MITADLTGMEHIIWDWNGTLLDDAHIATEVIGEILIENGLPAITLDEYRTHFCFPVENYYRKLGFDFNKTPFHFLADRFVRVFDERVKGAKLFDGVTDLLDSISNQGIQQSILSAASQTHLDEIVDHFGVTRYFKRIYGLDNHYAKSKLHRGKQLILDIPISKEKTVFIGDTDHDLEVGQELGIRVILLNGGHQNHSNCPQRIGFLPR